MVGDGQAMEEGGMIDLDDIAGAAPGIGRGVVPDIVGQAPQPRRKDAAIAFLKFMTSAENQAKWIAATGQSSPVIAANVGAKLDPHVAEIAALMNTASSLTAPPDTSYPLPVARTFYQAAAYVASGDKSPDDALDWLDATLKSMGKQTN